MAGADRRGIFTAGYYIKCALWAFYRKRTAIWNENAGIAAAAAANVVVGADELPELRRQSAEFAMHRAEEDIPGSFNLLSNHNHFTILEELENPEGSLTQLLVQLIKY